ncbi:serine hydrolase domain-containing protein [Pontibacter sp. G13]|uniref:serine hydrolase domain-containing protein n=1 Tax=Pontibacter sp. G13 TaxID=3074898 RepID=UPI00288BA9A8|nr:serine hydrolase domain-containing protein [Pontibacter sp. G13]WNJ16949.1 serine hydrolase domain-containing protein [Pontibacter sp. G13]
MKIRAVVLGTLAACALWFVFSASFPADVLLDAEGNLAAKGDLEVCKEATWEEAMGQDPKLDSLFEYLRTKKGFSGAVLVAQDGFIKHAGAYGFADNRKKVPLTMESEFQLASVSKMFTATSVLLLYQDGLIGLDDALCEYFPKFPYEDITIRHLLNHRTGLVRYMALGDQLWDRDKMMDCQDVVDLYAQEQPDLWFTPGRRFNYSNANYALLAALVEKVSGTQFETFIQSRIFNKLGMDQSYCVDHKARLKRDHHTIGYRATRRGYRAAGGDYLDGVMGDKGMHSTIFDLFKFDLALRNETLLAPSIMEEAYAPGSPERKRSNYGFGWRMRTERPDMVYHFGWWRGYRTCFMRDLSKNRTLIVLSNRDNLRHTVNFFNLYDQIFSTPLPV